MNKILLLFLIMSIQNIFAENSFSYGDRKFKIDKNKIISRLKTNNPYIEKLQVTNLYSNTLLKLAQFFGQVILPEEFDSYQYFKIDISGIKFDKSFKAKCTLFINPLANDALLYKCVGKTKYKINFYIESVLFYELEELGSWNL